MHKTIRTMAYILLLALSASLATAAPDAPATLCGSTPLTAGSVGSPTEPPILRLDPQGHSAMVHKICFTPDGGELVTCSDDKTIRIWDTVTGRQKRQIRGWVADGYQGRILALALDPTGSYLACSGWFKGTTGADVETISAIRIIDFKTGRSRALLKAHENVVNIIAFSPDGKFIASGDSDGAVLLWSVPDFQPGPKLSSRYRKDVYGLAWSPDSRFLATSSFDGSLKLFEASSGDMLFEREDAHDSYVHSVAISPDGRQLMTAGNDGTVKLWKVHGLEFVRTLKQVDENNLDEIVFLDDATVACGGVYHEKHDGEWKWPLYIIDISGKKPESVFWRHTNVVQHIAFCPANGLIASTGGNDSETFVWDPGTLEIKRTIKGRGKAVWASGFGLDGVSVYYGNTNRGRAFLLTSPIEKSFRLIDRTLSPAVPKSGYDGARLECRGVKLSSSGKLGDAVLWIGDDSVELPAENDTLYAYSWSRDGSYILAGSDFGLYRIDPATRKITGSFMGHDGTVWSLAVSPDSKTLLSGGADQTLRLWDIETCRLLLTIFIGDDDEWIAFTPDGYFDCSLDGAKYAGWHFNHGEDHEAEFFTFEQYRAVFYRPDIIDKALKREFPELPKVSFDTKPPVITKLSLAGKSVVEDEQAITTDSPEFEVKLESTGEWELRGVEVFVNGRAVAQRNYKGPPEVRFAPGNRSLTASYTFSVREQETHFRIYVVDEKGFASREKKITVKYTGREAVPAFYKLTDKVKLGPPAGTLHVLCVGVNTYTHPGMKELGLPNLTFAEKDATDMAELFRGQRGLMFTDVSVTLLTGAVSADMVLDAIEGIKQKLANKGDRIVVFFSAHGMRSEAGKYYLLMSGSDPRTDESLKATALSWDEIGNRLKSINDASEIVVLIDACYSGAVSALELGSKWKDKGVVLITSSRAGQRSQESAEWGNGAFTKAVVEGFARASTSLSTGPQTGFAPADYSKDNVLIVSEVLKYAITRVGEMTQGLQIPWVPDYDSAIEGKIFGAVR